MINNYPRYGNTALPDIWYVFWWSHLTFTIHWALIVLLSHVPIALFIGHFGFAKKVEILLKQTEQYYQFLWYFPFKFNTQLETFTQLLVRGTLHISPTPAWPTNHL